MIQTIVTPQKGSLDISVLLPDEYIGKQLRVLIYRDEEVDTVTTSTIAKKKPSDYFGTLSVEEGDRMHDYVANSRKEWERDI